MSLLKKMLPTLYFLMICIAIQLPLVFWLYPTEVDFYPTESIEGVYLFDGGSVRSGTSTRIGEKSLFCDISYLGPGGSCGRLLTGQVVTAKLARYKHLFGYSSVLLEAKAPDGRKIEYSPQLRVELWLSSSLIEVFRLAFFAAILIFYPVQQLYISNRGKKMAGNAVTFATTVGNLHTDGVAFGKSLGELLIKLQNGTAGSGSGVRVRATRVTGQPAGQPGSATRVRSPISHSSTLHHQGNQGQVSHFPFKHLTPWRIKFHCPSVEFHFPFSYPITTLLTVDDETPNATRNATRVTQPGSGLPFPIQAPYTLANQIPLSIRRISFPIFISQHHPADRG